MHKNLQISLSDGRRFGYAEYGDPGGAPFFYFHGFPGSRLEAALAAEAAVKLNIRIIAPDRPGYGLSDFKPGRRLVDWPDDVEELADKLNIGKFTAVGISGGAPYVAVCAWKTGSRLNRAGIICGLGPSDATEAGNDMRIFQKFWFSAGRKFPAFVELSAKFARSFILYKKEGFIDILKMRVSMPDKEVLLSREIREGLAASFAEAIRNDGRGFALDFLIYSRPWGFEPGEIKIPVSVWHGEKDFTVPVAFGKYYASQIPRCKAEFFKSEGHFSLPVKHMERILSELA